MIRILTLATLLCFLSISINAQQAVVAINNPPLMMIIDCDNCGDLKTITPNQSILKQFAEKLINAMNENSVTLNHSTRIEQLKTERKDLVNDLKLAKKDKNNEEEKDINKQISSLDKNIDKEEAKLKKAQNSHKKTQNDYTDSIYIPTRIKHRKARTLKKT
jgi:hypothetical protein